MSAPYPALEAPHGRVDGFFSQHPFECHLTVNTRSNVTSKRWLLWDMDLRFAINASAESAPRSHARPFVGYLKVNSSETLSFFGDKCPQNGSKNDLMAPRTTLECPHEGPSVAPALRMASPPPGHQIHARLFVGVPQSQFFRDLVIFWR